MEKIRDSTLKDMEGVEIKGNKTRFDVLVAASERAKQILEHYEQETNMSKTSYGRERRGERSSPIRIAEGDRKGSSSATAMGAAAKRKKFKVVIDNGPQPPLPLPQELKNAIQEMARGRNLSLETLVIEKGFFDTEVGKNYNRLSIPVSQINDNFLTEEENHRLRTPDKNDNNSKRDYIEVNIIEPSLERDTVRFGKWDMPKKNGKTSSCYVINGN